MKLTNFLASCSLVCKEKGLFINVSWSLLIVLLMKGILSDGVLEENMQAHILKDFHEYAIYHPCLLDKIQQNNNNSMNDKTSLNSICDSFFHVPFKIISAHMRRANQ